MTPAIPLGVHYSHVLTASAQSGRSVAQVLAELRAVGLVSLDLRLDELPPAAQRAGFGRQLAEAGFVVSSLHTECGFDRDPQSGLGRALVDAAVAVGCGRVMPVPGFFLPGLPRPEVRQRLIAGLADTVAYGQTAQVAVSVEDYDTADSPTLTSAAMVALAAAVPGLGYTFDTGNFAFADADELAAWDALRDRIAHVHAKDRADHDVAGGRPQTSLAGRPLYPCPVGSGRIQLATIVARLQQIGYSGYITIEHFDLPDQLGAILASARYLSGLLATESAAIAPA